METNPAFDKYMDRYFEFRGQWDSPSRCGLKVIRRKDGKTLAIATEIYRQNPGTPVTEWCAELATQIMTGFKASPEKSRLTFYGETFDLVTFGWDGSGFVNPEWKRLSRDQVDAMMEE